MEKEKRSLPFSQVFAFGTAGMFTYGFQLMITGYYLMYFMTDVIGFSTALAATLSTAIQWIKMMTMMFSGVIIDAINFKSGKYRTWVLIAGVGLGVFFPLSFTYFNIPQAAYVAIFLVLYTMMTISYNVGWTAMRAVMGIMSKNKSDMISLSTAAQIGGTASGVVYGWIGYPILEIGLWAGTKYAYAGAATIYGVMIIAGAIFLYVMCAKYEGAGAGAAAAAKQKRVKFTEMLTALKGPMIPFFASYSFSMAQSGFFSTLLVYYSTYVLNDAAAAATALSAVSVAGLVGSFLSPAIAKRFSKKNVQIVCQLLCAASYILLALIGRSAVPFIILRSVITFIGVPPQIVMSALANDIGDSIEMEGKEAPRALLQGLAGTTTRVGLVLSTAISGFGLAFIGYEQGVEFTADMVNKLVGLIAIGPAAVCVLSAVCMFFYRLDEKKIAEYNKQKHAQQ